jgi:hypothetical protein
MQPKRMKIWSLISSHPVVTTAIFLLIGIVCVVLGRLVFDEKVPWAGWSILEAIASWLLAAGIIVAFIQIEETGKNTQSQIAANVKSTNSQIAVGLIQQLRSGESIKALRYIYSLDEYEINCIIMGYRGYQEKQDQITHVLDKLELLAGLVEKEIIDTKLAFEIYGGSQILKCWFILGKNYFPEKTKQQGLYCENLKEFAKQALKYQIDVIGPKYGVESFTKYYRTIAFQPVLLADEFTQGRETKGFKEGFDLLIGTERSEYRKKFEDIKAEWENTKKAESKKAEAS